MFLKTLGPPVTTGRLVALYDPWDVLGRGHNHWDIYGFHVDFGWIEALRGLKTFEGPHGCWDLDPLGLSSVTIRTSEALWCYLELS